MYNLKESQVNCIANNNINITVEKVNVEDNGVIILTGPSSCGKGEVANSLCTFLSIPKDSHLSMGEILRKTVSEAKKDSSFRNILAQKYNISDKTSIFDTRKNPEFITEKAEHHKQELLSFIDPASKIISQLDWLDFCVNKGLLIPDEWTEKIIDASIRNSNNLHKGIFILDGYPRTINAAISLLQTLQSVNIPIIKIIHLSITKEEMKKRAFNRNRNDDTEESLERRYQFYIDHVLPCIDYLKENLGTSYVSLIDAHQPAYNQDGTLNIAASIGNVALSVLQTLGLPSFSLDIN
jgi:adenylate kinase family enzyme